MFINGSNHHHIVIIITKNTFRHIQIDSHNHTLTIYNSPGRADITTNTSLTSLTDAFLLFKRLLNKPPSSPPGAYVFRWWSSFILPINHMSFMVSGQEHFWMSPSYRECGKQRMPLAVAFSMFYMAEYCWYEYIVEHPGIFSCPHILLLAERDNNCGLGHHQPEDPPTYYHHWW